MRRDRGLTGHSTEDGVLAPPCVAARTIRHFGVPSSLSQASEVTGSSASSQPWKRESPRAALWQTLLLFFNFFFIFIFIYFFILCVLQHSTAPSANCLDARVGAF